MNQTSARKGAFTLVEMLVAIAVLSILLSVVFVPLRLAINSYHIGSSRTTAQNAAQASLDDMERDLRRATFVFPNAALAGVTDKAPFTNNKINSADVLGVPYTKSLDAADTGSTDVNAVRGVCDRIFLPAKPVSSQQKSVAYANTSRVDMILAVRGSSGVVLPVRPDDTVVTYYTRRQNISQPYSPVDNPLVLLRAEMPYRDAMGVLRPNGTSPAVSTASDPANADLSPVRLDACGGTSNSSNRGSLWLAHNVYGEANLEPLVQIGKGVQTLAIPRGIGLVASQAFKLDPTLNPTPPTPTVDEAPLVPDTSFQLSDTNGDGKIDHVSASLALEVFDTNQSAATSTNGQPTGQIVRAHRDFDLPNVR